MLAHHLQILGPYKDWVDQGHGDLSAMARSKSLWVGALVYPPVAVCYGQGTISGSFS